MLRPVSELPRHYQEQLNVTYDRRKLQTIYESEISVEFDVRHKPDHIEWEYIKFLPRTPAPIENRLIVIFKCKSDCQTIFRNETFSEIIRFVDTVITDDNYWPKMCLMSEDPLDHVDRFGCSN